MYIYVWHLLCLLPNGADGMGGLCGDDDGGE